MGGVGVEAQGHEGGGGPGGGEGDGGPGLRSRGDGEEGQEGQGPQEVELLLDREGPEVHEQLGCGGLEVVGAGRDLQPVRGEGRGTEDLALDADEEVALGEPGEEDRGRDEDDEGRQEAAGAAGPEAAEVDAPGDGALAEQERGDEEARHDEEDVDAEEAPGQPRGVEVEEQDRGDGEGPEAVETGRRRGRGRGSGPWPSGPLDGAGWGPQSGP